MADHGELTVALRPGLCSGHARCYAIAPGLYPIDDEGYSALEPTLVPENLRQLARTGAEACPEGAILMDETATKAG